MPKAMAVNVPTSVGIVPLIKLSYKVRVEQAVSFPSSDGTPEIMLLLKKTSFTAVSWPSSVGTDPVKDVETHLEKLILSTLVSRPS